jgi:hypothetical protein
MLGPVRSGYFRICKFVRLGQVMTIYVRIVLVMTIYFRLHQDRPRYVRLGHVMSGQDRLV